MSEEKSQPAFKEWRDPPPQKWITSPPIKEGDLSAVRAVLGLWQNARDAAPEGSLQRSHLNRALSRLADINGGGDRMIYLLNGGGIGCSAVMETDADEIKNLATNASYKNLGTIMVEFLVNEFKGADITLTASDNLARKAYQGMGFTILSDSDGYDMILEVKDNEKWSKIGKRWKYKYANAPAADQSCCIMM